MALPTIESVPDLSTTERAAILDLLFEPSTQLHTLSVPLLHEKRFESYDELISSVGVQLTDLSNSPSSSDKEWLESILGSHPRLGAKKVESAQSQAEQAQLKGSAEESEQLRLLNEQYESTFPGLKYVVFVNGRQRSVIMEDMQQRIAGHDIVAERAAAIRVCTGQVEAHKSLTIHRRCVRLPQIGHESSRADLGQYMKAAYDFISRESG